MNPSNTRQQLLVGASAATLLLVLVARILANGTAGTVEERTYGGAWISEFVVGLVSRLPSTAPKPFILSAIAAVFVAALLAWLYQRLVYNNWRRLEAAVLVAGIALNAILVDAITVDASAMPVMIAAATLIPAIRRLESVGDVQAEMSFGLVLPILLLASPATSLLVIPLAVAAALGEPEARRELRVFLAMLLVALMPTVIVLVGLTSILGAGTAAAFATIYAPLLALAPPPVAAVPPLVTTIAFGILPYAFVPLAYCVTKDRRKQPYSAVAVLALPLYLAATGALVSWPAAVATPAAALLAAFASWLAVARLTPILRAASLAFILIGAVLSWVGPRFAADTTPLTKAELVLRHTTAAE